MIFAATAKKRAELLGEGDKREGDRERSDSEHHERVPGCAARARFVAGPRADGGNDRTAHADAGAGGDYRGVEGPCDVDAGKAGIADVIADEKPVDDE